MVAPVGNQFWKVRSRHGREKIFATPEIMWEAACEYFQWVEDNPLETTKVTQYQGELVELPVTKMRAMTMEGLCRFLGVNTRYFAQFESNLDKNSEESQEFSTVICNIKETMTNQKFMGAAADLLNANIISRDLGLADKKDHTSSDGSMTPSFSALYGASEDDDGSES